MVIGAEEADGKTVVAAEVKYIILQFFRLMAVASG